MVKIRKKGKNRDKSLRNIEKVEKRKSRRVLKISCIIGQKIDETGSGSIVLQF